MNQISRAAYWPALAHLVETEQSIGHWAEQKGPLTHFLYEFVRFGVKQAWACLFAGLLLGLLILTFMFYPKDAVIARYDFLVLSAILIQVFMIIFGLETKEEAKVIFIFHIVGTIMEIFKTAKGSWIYPEPSILRIGGVPLFTGFMYASVGSFMARVSRLFDFEFTHHPKTSWLVILSLLIYANFFTHHYIYDIRYFLFLGSAIILGRCTIYYRIWKVHRHMPLLLSAFLAALFIWFAENIGTFTAAWVYPNQKKAWQMVSFGKLGSWFLLMIISYTLVVLIQKPTERKV